MHSAEPVDRMAMVSWMMMRMPPMGPIMVMAEAGGTRPLPASPEVRATLSALPARPSDVASAKGMVNQTMPPRMKPLCAEAGLAAMADCQYDWSTKTVPKLPMTLMMPNLMPGSDIMVRYEPWRLPWKMTGCAGPWWKPPTSDELPKEVHPLVTSGWQEPTREGRALTKVRRSHMTEAEPSELHWTDVSVQSISTP